MDARRIHFHSFVGDDLCNDGRICDRLGSWRCARNLAWCITFHQSAAQSLPQCVERSSEGRVGTALCFVVRSRNRIQDRTGSSLGAVFGVFEHVRWRSTGRSRSDRHCPPHEGNASAGHRQGDCAVCHVVDVRRAAGFRSLRIDRCGDWRDGCVKQRARLSRPVFWCPVRHRGRFRCPHCHCAACSDFELPRGCRAKSYGTMAFHESLTQKTRKGRSIMRAWKRSAIAASMLAACSAAAEPVKITNIGHGYYSGALYVAQREKLFEKHGLEADVSIVSYEHILTSAVQGKRVVAFFNIANRPVNNIIGNDALVAGADKLGIEAKVRRLKGMRVAMPSAGGSGEKMLGVLAKKYGLTLPEDIKSVYLGAEAPSYVAAFDRNLIDAALPFEPAGVLVQQAGKGRIFLNLMNGEVPEFRDILFMTLATHPDNIKDKPELLRKVAAAFSDAVKILKDDPKRGKAFMALEYPTMAAATNDGRMTESQARGTFDYLQPKGTQEVDFPSTFTNQFLPK